MGSIISAVVVVLNLLILWHSMTGSSILLSEGTQLWDNIICIGKNPSLEIKIKMNCTNTTPNFSSFIVNEVRNNTLIQLIDDFVVLREHVKIINKTRIQIQGIEMGSVIECDDIQAKESGFGFSFVQTMNLSLYKVTVRNCGALQNSTTIYDNPMDSHTLFRAAMYFSNCSDIRAKDVSFEDNIGTGVTMFDCDGSIDIEACNFIHNEIFWKDLNVYSGGGGLYIEFTECSTEWLTNCDPLSNQHNKNSWYFLNNCSFVNNTCTMTNNKSFSLFGTSNYPRIGRGGGGLSIWLRGHAVNNSITIDNTLFTENQAKYGGGANVHFQQHAKGNSIIFYNCLLLRNNASRGGGGLDVGTYFLHDKIPTMNNATITTCTFENNSAKFGGGSAFFSALGLSIDPRNSIEYSNCTWMHNEAMYGSAINVASLFTAAVLNHFGPITVFTDCKFLHNKIIATTFSSTSSSNQTNKGTGAIYAKVLSFMIHSSAIFESNSGTALSAVDSSILIAENATVNFSKNNGNFGGAISLVGFSSIQVSNNTLLTFTENHALFRGGAIYAYSIDDQRSSALGSCFIEYNKNVDNHLSFTTTQTTFIFDKNIANFPNSHSIHLSSLLPCMALCYPPKFVIVEDILNECVGNFTFIDESVYTQVSTEGSTYQVEDSLSSPFKIIPGKIFLLPFTLLDELGHTVIEAISASIISSTTQSTATLRNLYTANNMLTITGQPEEKGVLVIGSLYFRNVSFMMEFELLHCPPGFLSQTNSCVCAAAVKTEQYNSIPSCDTNKMKAYANPGFWVGYVDCNATGIPLCTEDDLYTATCPLGYCSNNGFDGEFRVSLPNVSSKNDLDELICGRNNRTDLLCGKCIENNSVYFHSWEYKCGIDNMCSYGILFYILSDIIPITIVFTFIILFGINFNSGTLNGFILYAQIIDSLSITVNGGIVYTSTESAFRDIAHLVYSPFNLNFFKVDSLSYCIFKGANFLSVIAMEAVALFYGLVLVIILICFMRSRYCYKLQFLCIKNGITNTTSLTKGLSTFLILCYSQTTRICFQILNIGWLRGKGGRTSPKILVFRMGYVSYFTGIHIPYALGAIICLITVVMLPPFMLLFYPAIYRIIPEHFQKKKILKIVLYRVNKYKPVFDTFQGYFKDKHRYFAGLYFAYRIFFVATFAITNTRLTFIMLSQVFLTIILALHLWIQPYHKTIYNFLDGCLFLLMSIINLLTFCRYYISSTQLDKDNLVFVGSIQLILVYLPAIVLLLYIIARLCWKRLCMKFCHAHQLSRFFPFQNKQKVEEFELKGQSSDYVEHEDMKDWDQSRSDLYNLMNS